MEELHLQEVKLIGRDKELNQLKEKLGNAILGNGSTILISGEAGVGKTRLIDEFKKYATEKNLLILPGSTAPDSIYPFLAFSKALENEIEKPLFQDLEYKSFNAIFAVNKSGILVAQASSETGDMDADIFAGMLSAVQNYVRSLFDKDGTQRTGLGRLEYGDMKIMIEHGSNIFLTAVFKGAEHPDMNSRLKNTLKNIEVECGDILESWVGNMADVVQVQNKVITLANEKFLVKRDLKGVRLENERIKIADEVLEILRSLSGQQPLLLLLEDLHWADESSLFVLNYLSRNIKDENIMIAGTLRPEMTDVLQITLENMTQEGNFVLMPLIQLGSESISSLVEAMHPGHQFPESFTAHLTSACEGNPFFVIELLRQMKLDGNITTIEGKDILISQDYSIPGSVEEVVQKRLENLDPETMALAEYTSCIGRISEPGAIMSIKAASDPVQTFQKLQNSGIIILNNGTAEFCHAIFQDVIYKGIGERWKSVYHKNLGEYYEEAYRDNLDEVFYDLAKHFSRSNEHEKGFDYCYRAGEKAENIFALEQAISFYKDSLNSLSIARSIDDRQDKKPRLLVNLGELYSIVCDYDNSLKNYNLAMEIEQNPIKRSGILRMIAEDYERVGDYEKSREECAKGLELLGEQHSPEKAMLLRALGWTYLRTGDYDKAVELLTEDLDIATALGEKEIAAQAQHAMGTVYFDKGDYDSALDNYMKGIQVFEEMGSIRELAGAFNNIGLVYNFKGELDKAMEYYEQCLEMMEKLGDKFGIAAANGNIGLLYKNTGDMEKSLDFNEHALAIMEVIGDRRGVAYSLINIGELYWQKGDIEKSIECYERSLDICLAIGDKRALVHNYYGLAECYIELGKPQLAFENAEIAIDKVVEIGAKTEEGFCRRIMAMTHRDLANWELAIEEFQKAKQILEEVGENTELARLCYEHALLYRARNEPDKAIGQLKLALEMFQEMGMKQWEERARKALVELNHLHG